MKDPKCTKQSQAQQGTKRRPQEHPEGRNPAGNHSEFHGEVTRHGQPKHTRNSKTTKINNMR
jgi:hypothetical protein